MSNPGSRAKLGESAVRLLGAAVALLGLAVAGVSVWIVAEAVWIRPEDVYVDRKITLWSIPGVVAAAFAVYAGVRLALTTIPVLNHLNWILVATMSLAAGIACLYMFVGVFAS